MNTATKSYDNPSFVLLLNAVARDITAWAEHKGFWNLPRGAEESDDVVIARMKKVEKLALIASESVGEGLEAVRKNPLAPSDHIPDFTAEEEEMADAIIRILDYSGRYHLRIGECVVEKMRFNEGRPYMHGKHL